MTVFRHGGQIKTPYYTVTVEVMGSSSGIREENREDSAYVARGQFLARMARRQSLISHVQTLSRAVPDGFDRSSAVDQGQAGPGR